ncbi:MAG TPA: EAL domain-containing protein, partial [Burkholderiales bacterium]|nr:EAL domain-containing protein [Burkholderiales bacterium]
LRETCRAAIDSGVFAGVWIGLRDPSAEELRFSESIGALLPPAGDGKVDVALPGLDFPALAEPALREREVLVHADLSAFLSPGATEAPAEAGIVCAAVAPLAMGRNVFGALAALAADEEFFGAEETNLLSNLAADLSFALDDVEKRKQLHYLAHYDTVSSLANRALLAERIGHFVQEASRSGEALALALMDLERFGAINDSFGRSAGDELLRQLGDRLREHFPSDHLARVGMNTFAVLFPRIREFLRVAGLVEDRLRAVFAKPFEAGGRVLNLSARFGISVFPADGEDVEALLRNAEAALRRAKAQGERFVYYEPALNANVAERLDLENRLRFALREEQFLLYYQPKIDAASGKVEGLEALIRWKPPDADPVSPGMFVPILEETGLILEVGRWVIHEAAKTYASWYRKYGAETPRIAVNVSALQMRRPDFAMDIVTLAEKAGAHNGLDVEITESVVMQEIELSTNALARLREVGVRIGMDDFGTGYSSLSYLARLPMDLLKIDRSFIASMMSNPENMEIVAAIVSMAHALKLSVVAEGVETQQQLDKLKSLDCDQIQGYLVSPPVSARAIERLLWGERAPSA